MVGRIYAVNPNEGDKYYLCLLLNHVKGATSFVDLKKVRGHLFTTFQEKNKESLQTLIEYIYPNITNHNLDISHLTDCAILITKNEYVDQINQIILNQTPEDMLIYKSYDSVPDDIHELYQQEFLSSITPNGLPSHKLHLKI
ncbi:17440_t:CDS:2, partial [Racocetra fulgida]